MDVDHKISGCNNSNNKWSIKYFCVERGEHLFFVADERSQRSVFLLFLKLININCVLNFITF